MPKMQRRPDEVEAVREDIMAQALDLIVSEGYDGFSMRKLAGRLGIAAKTIYNYFHNQDELYLGLLTKGFEQLYDCLEKAAAPHETPADRLGAAIAAYINFGLEQTNIYNLMFTWHVPKFNDYIDTPMESIALAELNTALKCADFFMDLIKAFLGEDVQVKEQDIRFEMVQFWSQMHGYVAGINNTLLDYMYEDPKSIRDRTIDRIVNTCQRELKFLRSRLALKVVSDKETNKAGLVRNPISFIRGFFNH